MNPIFFTANGVDMSQYLKRIEAEPSGPGVVGSATLYLDKQAGGLDLRFGDEVKVWQSYNSGGSGIAPNGRLFGGIVVVRDTGNMGTTKTWALSCASYNYLLKKLARKRATPYALVLTAGTFSAQVRQVLDAVQRNNNVTWPPVQIDGSTGVVDLVGSMPAATYPGGQTLDWYLAQLCVTARSINSALWPAYFIDVDRTSGVGDVFGGPVLWFYDAATTPLPTSHYTDTPGTPVGAATIFGKFRRLTDGVDVVQMRESAWGLAPSIATYADDVSQGLYPNRFANHGRPGNTGYWTMEALEDKESTTTAEANARLAGTVQPVAVPRDSVEFDVEGMALPGTVTGITWALENFNDEPMRVAQAIWDLTEETGAWTRITAGQLILELGEDGHAILSVPVEGEGQPQPPGALTLTYDTVDGNPRLRLVHTKLTAPQSPSPNVAFYRLYNVATSQILLDHVLPASGTVEFDFRRPAGQTMTVKAYAVSGAGQESDPGVSPFYILPATVPVITPPTSAALDSTINSGHGWGWRPDGAYTGITWAYVSVWGAPDSYEFQYWRNGDPTQVNTWTLPGNALSAYIKSLYTPDTWNMRVRAKVADWFSTYATVTQLIPAEDVAEPSALTIDANVFDPQSGRAMIDLSWTAPSPAAWQNPIVAYYVYYDTGRGVEVLRVDSGTVARIWVTAGLAFTLWITAVTYTEAESDHIPLPHMSLTAASPVHSLLFNGSFELEDPAFANLAMTYPNPYGWGIIRSGAVTGGLDTTKVREGRKSLYINAPNGSTDRLIATSRPFLAAEGEVMNIAISVWNNTAGVRDITYTLLYYNSAGVNIGSSINTISVPAGSWQDYTIQVTLSVANTKTAVIAVSNPTTATNFEFWVDRLSVTYAIKGNTFVDFSVPSSKLTNTGVLAGSYDLAIITVDTAGRVTVATSRAGTSFPGSATLNDYWYRTDLGLLCRYDGARWLAPGQGMVGTYGLQSTIANKWASPGYYVTLYFKPHNNRATAIERVQFSYVIDGSTHNSSNYWKIYFYRYRSGAGWQQIDDGSWTTDKTTVSDDTNFKKEIADMNSNRILDINQNYVRIDIEAVGTPSPFGFSGIEITANEIVT